MLDEWKYALKIAYIESISTDAPVVAIKRINKFGLKPIPYVLISI